MTIRRFEFKDAKSSKFWEISQAGAGVTVRYGKSGTQGQSLTKELADEAAALKQLHKLIAEKTGKGYVELGGAAVARAAVAPVGNAIAAPAPKAKAAAKKPKGPQPPQDPEATPESLMGLLNTDDATNRLLARHPKASAALLEQLSHSSDKATRQAVVLNPGSPKDTLTRLAPQFPADFFKNPAFDWLLLEDPNLLTGLGGGVFKNILKRPECPVSFLKWAALHGDESQQLAVAMNPNTPEECLQELLKSGRDAVMAAAGAHVKLAKAAVGEGSNAEAEFLAGIAQLLSKLPVDDACEFLDKGYLGVHHLTALPRAARYMALDFGNLKFLSENYGHPVDVPKALSETTLTCPDWRLNLAILRSGNASNELIEKITTSDITLGWYMRDAARAPFCPAKALAEFIKIGDWPVRLDVANNANCQKALLEILATDQQHQVRGAVARNPNCPTVLLEILARDKDKHIREAAIDHLKELACPSETWANDAQASRLAGNYNCPERVLLLLASHSNSMVRHRVSGNLKCPPSALEVLSRDINVEIRANVALHPNCQDHVLSSLALDKNSVIRRHVVSNPTCPKAVLDALLSDSDSKVRREALARHPTQLIELLSSDEALANWIRSGGVLMPWLPKHRDDPSCELLSPTKVLISKGTGHKHALIRALALSLPDVGVEALAKNQNHLDWMVRAAVARNRNCPEVVLKKLEHDSNEIVAALARLSGVKSVDSKNVAAALKGDLRQVEPEVRPLLSAIEDSIKRTSSPSVLMSRTLMHWLPAKQKNALLISISEDLARNIATPGHLLETLAKDKSEDIRRLVAQNPSCPPAALKTLANDKDKFIREDAISNKSCPLSLLELLAKDRRIDVRRTAALNRNCSEPLLNILANDKVDDVRAMVALNSRCPLPLLEILAKDESHWVRSMVAVNGNCPLPLLETFASDKSSDVRVHVARNEKCPLALLNILASDSFSNVRRAVVNNDACSESLLHILAKDKEGAVAWDAKLRIEQPARDTESEPALELAPHPPELLQSAQDALLTMMDTPPPPLTLKDCVYPACPPKLKFLAPLQPDCPKEQLFKAANSPEPLVRLAAALNPMLQRAQVMRLVGDPDLNVQRAAARHPRAA